MLANDCGICDNGNVTINSVSVIANEVFSEGLTTYQGALVVTTSEKLRAGNRKVSGLSISRTKSTRSSEVAVNGIERLTERLFLDRCLMPLPPLKCAATPCGIPATWHEMTIQGLDTSALSPKTFANFYDLNGSLFALLLSRGNDAAVKGSGASK